MYSLAVNRILTIRILTDYTNLYLYLISSYLESHKLSAQKEIENFMAFR